MAQTITINDTIPFVIGRHRDTRKAVIAQNALAEADMLAGTLLTPNSDGKLVPCVAEDSDNNVDATYPVAALIHDIPAEALVAGDVAADGGCRSHVLRGDVHIYRRGVTGRLVQTDHQVLGSGRLDGHVRRSDGRVHREPRVGRRTQEDRRDQKHAQCRDKSFDFHDVSLLLSNFLS